MQNYQKLYENVNEKSKIMYFHLYKMFSIACIMNVYLYFVGFFSGAEFDPDTTSAVDVNVTY